MKFRGGAAAVATLALLLDAAAAAHAAAYSAAATAAATPATLLSGISSDDDLWRPRLHFFFRDPKTGIGFHSNDATGSYYDESTATWHALYDCTPPASYSAASSNGSYSWCEASSTDLVRWTQATRAILPENVACDWENLETGAIAMSPLTGDLVAIFSAKGNETHPPPSSSREWEHICAASASAHGTVPFKVLDKVVIENPNHGNGFRDPSRAIALADSNYSYVVVGTDAGYNPQSKHRDPEAQLAQATLWVNTDGSLLSWAPAGVLLADGNARFPECPDLFPLSPLGDVDGDLAPEAQQYYVLLASETYRRGTRWYLGTLHPTNASVNNSTKNDSIGAGGYQMKVASTGSLDYNYGTKSMSYYAPRTMAPIRSANGKGRRVLLGWIRADPNGRAQCDDGGCAPYNAHHVNWTFGDFAAFPRELWLREKPKTLAQRFVPELQQLRKSRSKQRLEVTVDSSSGRRPVGKDNELQVQGRELELVMTVTATGEGCGGTSWSASISFLRSETGQEATTLSIQHTAEGNRTLLLDRSRSAWNSSWADTSNITAPLNPSALSEWSIHNNTLHAFIDRSIVSVIADNATGLTARVFPQQKNSTSVVVAIEGQQHNANTMTNCTIMATFVAWSLQMSDGH
jgi:sucrose-6-phosphate hydrolase SacC (GH32 family)